MATKKPVLLNPLNYLGIPAGRSYLGIPAGRSPSTPAPKSPVSVSPAATVGPPQGADIYNPAGAKTPKPVTTEGGVKISAQETAKFNPASPVYEETPRGEMSAEKQAAIAARIRREELARTGIGSDSFAAFVNTLKLIIGEKEASQPYITKLFQIQNAYRKAGYTADEALNFTLKDARNLPELAPFKNRFKAIFAIEDLKAQGKYNPAIPTIREYILSENALLETLNTAGLTDLATQDSVADFFSTGKSVKEITEIVDVSYQSIRKAPKSVRGILEKDFSSVTDAQLVKAMVTGKKGVQALQDQIAGTNVLGASQEQSTKKLFSMTSDQAMGLAKSGETYASTKTGVKNIVGYLPQLQAATLRYKQGQFTDQDAINAEFNDNADALQTIKKSRELEESEFKKKTGLLPSSLRGKGTAGQL